MEIKMYRLVYRYSFSEHVPMQDVEDALMLALLAVRCLHGQAAVRLDARFSLDKDSGTCTIDAETPVGSDLARIFTGFVTRGFGSCSFDVEAREERTGRRGLVAMLADLL
jgi:hypothetical protein